MYSDNVISNFVFCFTYFDVYWMDVINANDLSLGNTNYKFNWQQKNNCRSYPIKRVKRFHESHDPRLFSILYTHCNTKCLKICLWYHEEMIIQLTTNFNELLIVLNIKESPYFRYFSPIGHYFRLTLWLIITEYKNQECCVYSWTHTWCFSERLRSKQLKLIYSFLNKNRYSKCTT